MSLPRTVEDGTSRQFDKKKNKKKMREILK